MTDPAIRYIAERLAPDFLDVQGYMSMSEVAYRRFRADQAALSCVEKVLRYASIFYPANTGLVELPDDIESGEGEMRPQNQRPKPRQAQLTMRLPMELREALIAEADRTNTAISRVAENWMEAGRRSEQTISTRLEAIEAQLSRLNLERAQ